MMHSVSKTIFSVFLGLLAIQAHAHRQETLFNTVNLQVQVEREIPNDEMTAVLAAEYEGNRPSEIAARINADMQKALEIIKPYKDVASRTQNYQTHPVYKNQSITGWRGSQHIELRSTNIPVLTELVGKLQESLQVKQMNFSPTDATRKKYENDLIEEAMLAFKQRVEIVKKHMEQKNSRMITIDVNTSGQRPPVVYQHSLARTQEFSSAPAVEAGTSKLTVTASGSVQFF